MRKKMIAGLLLGVVAALMLVAGVSPTMVYADAMPVRTVSVYGAYRADIQAALNRINAIRKEACDEGVPDPRDESRGLTADDYVPIQWSSDLEEIARIRAAEASLRVGHTRPNGESCFSVVSSNGVQSWGEVLAWNYSGTMVSGIEQWYDEKADWVGRNDNAVTGHYTQMIDPDSTRVGLGCFVSDYGVWPTTVSGEFSWDDSLDTARGAAADSAYVQVDTLEDYLSRPELTNVTNGRYAFYVGNKASFRLTMKASIEGYDSIVFPAQGVTLASSDPSIMQVSGDRVIAKKPGRVTISAASGEGLSGSKAVTVELKKGTVFKSGALKYKVTRTGSGATVAVVSPVKSRKSLKRATIPSTLKIGVTTYKVTQIQKGALKGCKNLKKITVKSTYLKSVGKNAIKGIHKKATIKVPKAKYKKYTKLFKASTGFKAKTMRIKKF